MWRLSVFLVIVRASATLQFETPVCRPKCGQYDYEFVPCLTHQDRQCKDMVNLPKPLVSSNIIYEDRKEAKTVTSHVVYQQEYKHADIGTISLKRGSNLNVNIKVHELNLAPLYQAADHSSSNDNAGFTGNASITKEFCAFPIPIKYQLSAILHQDVTTRARYNSCGTESRRQTSPAAAAAAAVPCELETGYHLNPRDSCQTYSIFGRLPALDSLQRSVTCVRPGTLTDAFGISAQLSDVTSIFVDKTIKCAEQRLECDSCSLNCARQMQSYQGSNRCTCAVYVGKEQSGDSLRTVWDSAGPSGQ